MERVELETILPPEPLRAFVRRYLYANRPLESPVAFRARPTGYAYFSSFFGTPQNESGSIDGRAFERVSRWFLFGQITDHEVDFRHGRSIRMIAAELAATGHHRLFGISGERVLGLAAPLDDVAPGAVALAGDSFARDAKAPRSAHIAEANAFFARLARRALPADPLVEDAVRLLETSDGAIRIAEVCERLAVNARTLHRRFRRIVGIGPKFFGQVMQINRVVDILYSGRDPKLAQIAQAAGFYDQPHLNHAMRRFFQEGPRQFLRSDHDAYRSFLAGSRRFGSRPRRQS